MHGLFTANAQGEDIELSLDIARLNYEEKDFKSAYECLSSVLDNDPRNLEARELRLLTAKHLNPPLNDGQSDAEFLVEAEPHRVRPYLLLIDSLLGNGRFRDAMLLARTATFRAYHTDPDFRKLQALSEELQHTELNFLLELPAEVLCEIFALLPFKTRLTCISVSKRWRNVLTNIPDFWTTIDVGMAYKKDSVILSLKNFSAWSRVQKLVIPGCSRIFGALLQYKFQYIRKLDIIHTADSLDHLVFLLVMRAIGQSWQEVLFSSNVSVRLFFAAAAQFCPNLKKVIISDYFASANQREIGKELLMELDDSLDLEGTVSIKTLVLDICDLDAPTRGDIFPRCTSLEELVLTLSDQCFSGQNVFRSMLALPALHSLTIEQDVVGYYVHGLSDDSTDLCALLEAKPPVVLDLEAIPMCREAIQKISRTMRQGILKRYRMEFQMEDENDRWLLEKKSVLDPTAEDAMAESEEEEQQLYGEDEDELIYNHEYGRYYGGDDDAFYIGRLADMYDFDHFYEATLYSGRE